MKDNDWPVQPRVIPRAEARKLGHDVPPGPTRSQADEHRAQLEDEEPELPFEDD